MRQGTRRLLAVSLHDFVQSLDFLAALLGREKTLPTLSAVKFSDAGTVVKVVLVEEPERFVLRVVDQGPGILDAERERIFGKFQRG